MKMKYIVRGIAFLIGLSILLYPTISNQWNTYRNSKLNSEYERAVDELDPSENQKMIKKARKYNKTLVGKSIPDVFVIRDEASDAKYESLLNPTDDGIMGYVDIPKIDVQLPIYHYSTEEVLEKGAGHICGSSLPVGGKNTHTVISAHRGLPQAKMFRDLDRLKKGDLFYFQVLGETLAYEIDLIQVVEPDETRSLAITKGVDYATLVTCTPYAVNTHRMLVRGHRVPYEKEIYQEQENEVLPPKLTSVVAQAVCVLIGVVIAIVMVWCLSAREKKKNKR
ncbi:MAG: class C sortase [Lachnospiraceae bacterium]